jgi:hypothetical protein
MKFEKVFVSSAKRKPGWTQLSEFEKSSRRKLRKVSFCCQYSGLSKVIAYNLVPFPIANVK